VTDDRQTDHATEKCVAVGGIACTRAIPPNNYYVTSIQTEDNETVWKLTYSMVNSNSVD